MKEIKNYLHFHLGCDVKALDGGTMIYKLIGIDNDGEPLFITKKGEYKMHLSKFILMLRPLADMTDEECDKYGIESDGGEFLYGSISSDCTVGGHHHILEITRIAEVVRSLCEDGFDCFELIEAGLAIDKTKK
jgi:hypothetical protein